MPSEFNPPTTLLLESDIQNSIGMDEVVWWIPIPCNVACIINSNHSSRSSFSHLIKCFGPQFFAILSMYLSLSKKKPHVWITNIVWFSFPTIFSSYLSMTMMLLLNFSIRYCMSLVHLMNFWFSNFTLNRSVLTSQPNIILMGDSWTSPRIFLRHSVSDIGRGSLYEFGLKNASMIIATALHIRLMKSGKYIANTMISSI